MSNVRIFWEEEIIQEFKKNTFYICTNAYMFFYEEKSWATQHMFSFKVTNDPEQDQIDVEKWVRFVNSKNKLHHSYVNPNTPIFVLDVDGRYMQIAAGEKVGWVFLRQFMEFKELMPSDEKS